MSDRPNLLLILTDQQRADTIHAGGNPVIRTPALDRLCREGVRFDNAFTPSPVCVAARCSMVYGQYPATTGCYNNGYAMPTDGRKSMMDALTEAGYRTHGIGKMHFTKDPHALRGFQSRERQEEMIASVADDEYLTFLHDNGFGHVCDPHGIRGEMYYVPQPSQMPASLHPTQWVGDRTVSFIESQEAAGGPWFLFTSFVHPHPPFTPPNPWHKLYRAPSMPPPKMPPDADALLTYINRHQNRYKYRDQGIDRNLVRCMKAYYYACISFVDFQVQRILAALESAGQLDNTLIVFSSDHGELLGDYGCFGKRSMHDSAARIPLLVRHPGRFASGRVCTRPASLVDVMPTMLAAAGTAAERMDGEDLADVAAGRSDRGEVFSQFERAGKATYMIATEQWKYFHSAPDGRDWLFDRDRDPDETRSVSGEPGAAAAQRALKLRLIDHLKRSGETAGLDGDDWKAFPTLQVPADPDAGLIFQDHPWANQHIPGYSAEK